MAGEPGGREGMDLSLAREWAGLDGEGVGYWQSFSPQGVGHQSEAGPAAQGKGKSCQGVFAPQGLWRVIQTESRCPKSPPDCVRSAGRGMGRHPNKEQTVGSTDVQSTGWRLQDCQGEVEFHM